MIIVNKDQLDMLDSNPIMNSVLQIAQIEMRDDFTNSYTISREELGDNFEEVMSTLKEVIFDVRAECKAGTSIIEVVVLLIMDQHEDYSKEENDRCNKYLKACAMWLIEKGER